MNNIAELQICTEDEVLLGTSPFAEYDKPSRSLRMDVIEWKPKVHDPASLVNKRFRVRGTYIRDGHGDFINDMALAEISKGSSALFKA